ncbi:diguanylate cyclase domain-containing protein [Cloacibacillus porcorum]|uniref:diguanylate cyclase domain-containing protein n=1 Tax=Cloacibacillus porcorum TaxID=1197717 RepID=UPI0023F0D2D8|nr:diguanylate cyclase [Cloacibacillus porcorum]
MEGTECQISASAGIAIYPHAGKNFETLYRNADTALYLAKDSGRGTYKIYDAYGGVMF